MFQWKQENVSADADGKNRGKSKNLTMALCGEMVATLDYLTSRVPLASSACTINVTNVHLD